MGTPVEETTARRRGRPARIGREDIVDAAIAVGLDTFSMQAVATHLGVSTPALYSHVSGRDEITDLAHQRLRDRLAEVAPEHDTWDGWLRAFAVEVHRHVPASAAGFLDEVRTAGTGRVLSGERGLRLLIEAGFSPEDAGYAVWLVFRTAVGADADRALAGFLGTTADLLPGDPTDASDPPADTLAATRQVHAALTADDHRPDPFAFDLEVVLAGIAARLADRPAPSPSADQEPIP